MTMENKQSFLHMDVDTDMNSGPTVTSIPSEIKEKKAEEKVESLDDAEGVDPRQEVKLISAEKEEFMVPIAHTKMSALLTTAFTDKDAKEVHLKNVNSQILKLVIMYMNHHKGIEMEPPKKPLRSNKFDEVVTDKWDATFLADVDGKDGATRQQLYDLFQAANYLDIKSLLHLGAAKIASLIKGQPLEKIKEILCTGTVLKPSLEQVTPVQKVQKT